MLRGRIVSANGVRAEDLKVPPSQSWVLQSDRGITYSDTLAAGLAALPKARGGRRTTPGRRSSRSSAGWRRALGLRVGDPVTVNVLGRNIEARVANLRTLDWQSLGINFAMVFSPAACAAHRTPTSPR